VIVRRLGEGGCAVSGQADPGCFSTCGLVDRTQCRRLAGRSRLRTAERDGATAAGRSGGTDRDNNESERRTTTRPIPLSASILGRQPAAAAAAEKTRYRCCKLTFGDGVPSRLGPASFSTYKRFKSSHEDVVEDDSRQRFFYSRLICLVTAVGGGVKHTRVGKLLLTLN